MKNRQTFIEGPLPISNKRGTKRRKWQSYYYEYDVQHYNNYTDKFDTFSYVDRKDLATLRDYRPYGRVIKILRP